MGQSVPGQIQVPESSILYDPSADDVVDKVRIVQELSQLINKQVSKLCDRKTPLLVYRKHCAGDRQQIGMDRGSHVTFCSEKCFRLLLWIL